jgi:site-specific DNA-cytosine methylase
MKYLSEKQRSYINNHFSHYPDKTVSSRFKINDKISSYYNAKTKRFHVHRNDQRKTGFQALRFVHTEGTVGTLTSMPIKYYDQCRYATAEECASYQGFPDTFILPKTKIYELFGNAVSVPVAEHVIKKLSDHGKADTMIDLCSGIGGFHLAATKVFPSIKCMGFSDIKPAAIKCYQENFPDTPNLGDLTTAVIPKVDLVCAGFPCQPFSMSNKRVKEHKLVGMWKHVMRAVRESEARFVVLENVIPLVKSPIFEDIQRSFEKLGYVFQYDTYNSKDFGLKQNRKRLYMFMYKL